MVDIMDVFKSLNISIETVFKNPEKLNFVPDHFKTKKMCQHAVKKLTYLLIKITLSSTIKFVPECMIKLLINVLLHFFYILDRCKSHKHRFL